MVHPPPRSPHLSLSPEPIQLLVVCNDLRLGGAEQALCRILPRLDRSRFRASVVTLLGPAELDATLREGGVPIHNLCGARSFGGMARAAGRLARFIRTQQVDLLQGWLHQGSLAAWMARGLTPHHPPVVAGIRVGLVERNRPLRHRLTFLALRLVSSSFTRILFNSRQSLFDHVRAGFPPDTCLTIPNGVDLDRFKPTPAYRQSLRQSLGLPPSTLLVGCPARLDPLKDHGTFLEAAALLAQRNEKVHFVLAGRGVHAGSPTLAAPLQRLSLRGRVHLLGATRDMPALLAGLDICSLSSISEGQPNVLIEAQACGVLCVATDVGDCRELIGRYGAVVPSRQPQALADAWETILSQSHQQRQRQGQEARAAMAERFALSRVVDAYQTLYLALAGRGP